MTRITQADRDAAKAYWLVCNEYPLAEHFARHREAALTTAQSEADALRGEIERLRGALEMLAPSLDYLPHPQCVEAIDAVRAALSEPMP